MHMHRLCNNIFQRCLTKLTSVFLAAVTLCHLAMSSSMPTDEEDAWEVPGTALNLLVKKEKDDDDDDKTQPPSPVMEDIEEEPLEVEQKSLLDLVASLPETPLKSFLHWIWGKLLLFLL